MAKKRVRNDILLAAAVLAAAGILYWILAATSGPGAWAVVEREGTELVRLPLNVSQVYIAASDAGENRICTGNGAVWIEEADCPDKLCVGMGKIRRTHQRLVCLPHRLVVRVIGGDGSMLDGVAE